MYTAYMVLHQYVDVGYMYQYFYVLDESPIHSRDNNVHSIVAQQTQTFV